MMLGMKGKELNAFGVGRKGFRGIGVKYRIEGRTRGRIIRKYEGM